MENKELVKQHETEEIINPWLKLEVVKSCFAPSLSPDEFKIFVGLGKSIGANPFTREIWAVKYGGSAAQIFCGRDFYRRKAQEQPDYNGHIVNSVYENDGFSIKNGQPEHIVNSFKDRGVLVGAFCTVYKKTQQMPFFVMVKLDEYNKGQSNWKPMPDTMIKKVAEAQALRGAYQGIFRGTYDESEIFEAKVINQESEELKLKRIQLSKLISECQDSEITDAIVDEVTTAESEGKLTIENYDKWIAKFK
jgi:phage recombination protein Bet